ncbi:MAG: DDE-type integrase/transposase/recombinase [Sulfurimonas sp.]|uniref:Mu transposase C-terminal domain-containing protein n=1 Tax=Sulfurimonas sp. TaxID=2022749 RepID=UPI0025F4EFCF|nr:Mu transposase C-terminal domain-containing protein [Sulfurimonas sp.]MCK9490710.1 DDE-type integrase/transposase/recombinase [Sulfurimonas sp.]
MDDIKSVKLDRSRIEIKQNEYVEYHNEIYKVSQLLDFSEIIGISIKDKRAKRLLIKDVKPVAPKDSSDNIAIYKDLSDISDYEYKEIEERYLAIKPLLSNNMSREDIEKHAKEIDVHYTTLYRWLKNYKSTGTLLGLASKPSGRIKGETRLLYSVEKIIQKVIDTYYLTKQKPSVQAVINRINIECKNQNYKAPGKNTIRNRIHQIAEYEKLKRQGNRSIARNKFEPVPGSFNADYPLQLIEIDHTPVDLIVVDDETRKPIGRPWLTIAIDIYSRMIVGYYLSLNAPSVTSVAMCITSSVLPKDELLLKLDIDSNWDVWGFPTTIHVDNGADFRAEAVQKAGLTHGINIEFRPVGKTNFGGHVERAIGTIMSAVHELPGTTFSNIQKRQEYNSDEHASLTFSEFEKWLVTYITKVYHKRKHHGIDISPEEQWEEGIFGEDSTVGLIPKPTDALTVMIDFLPIFERTIQKNGVNIDGLNYYDNLLRSRINKIDESTKRKKVFVFKRDPRDISYVWFYDDITLEYFKIPLADQSMPIMSLWEFESIKNRIKEKGSKTINNAQILEAHDELNQQINESAKKSKKARREQQRLKNRDIETASNDTPSKRRIQGTPSVDNSLIWDSDVPDFG